MNPDNDKRMARTRLGGALLTELGVPMAALALAVAPALGGGDPCAKTAVAARQSCRQEAVSDFWLARAKCENLATFQERVACTLEALEELGEELELCGEQHDARLALCAGLGGGFYQPSIDPDDFGPLIDNPWLPLLPGTTWLYEKDGEEGLEQITVTVTDETVEILGVECTVVRDTVTLDGELVEDTFDWFAQDLAGNVWYFGELSLEYEDGELVALSGSWKAGVDGALPGIVMLADPQVGDLYRQEYLVREAEDAAGVLSTCEAVTVPYGSFGCCLQTEDFTPLEPDALEQKFYAQGVGLVLELDPESGERVELIAVTYD